MKNKHDLLFAILYFACIFVGYVSIFFNPLFDNIYYGHLEYVFNSVTKIIIYIIISITLSKLYKKYYGNEKKKVNLELGTKKALILYCITLFFITVISIISGWQLKPLSDLGSKYTLIELYNKLADMAVLIVEVYLMMKIYNHFDLFYISNFKNYDKFSFSIFFVLFTYGIYRLIVDFNIYQFIFFPFIILLGFIYPYTQKSFSKTYLIALLVFLF